MNMAQTSLLELWLFVLVAYGMGLWVGYFIGKYQKK